MHIKCKYIVHFRWGSSTQDNQCEHRTGEKKKTAKSK